MPITRSARRALYITRTTLYSLTLLSCCRIRSTCVFYYTEIAHKTHVNIKTHRQAYSLCKHCSRCLSNNMVPYTLWLYM